MIAMLAVAVALSNPRVDTLEAQRTLHREEMRRFHQRCRHLVEERRKAERRLRHRLAMRWLARRGNQAVSIARGYLGVPYVWGGSSPAGFDCSGLVQYVYAKVGLYLPRTSWDQAAVGRQVPFNEIRPGDLVFSEGGGHVGIYAGGGEVLNAPYTGAVVSYAPLSYFQWATRP